jgi:hypothetical protein
LTRQTSIGVARRRWATILLLADAAHPDGQHPDEQIAAVVGLSVRQLDGTAEAQLVTRCGSDPPDGRDRWTLQLLCDELVRLKVVTYVSPETVRTCLKKTNSGRGRPSGSASPRRPAAVRRRDGGRPRRLPRPV